ncbi:MAG: hypothetical protein A2186_02975 [Candidatus Levybacteria bacterium RIFOXYA1_FULL_41_10]|nr:MAG: hypothetical protein UT46_C0003G0046 [Candidatus Levybacteria bacterium GW2011_GWA1_39_34]KKR72262.1 MAG: hypothetical protein UU15_C0032G0002 [Candidatus Levybacteria bacterium GW2011_GWC2_40_7]KKR95308.1 MAG: hypothetical protein UU45_C0002G0020 [Candidatus Levybacteria bacterium GW2011_GWA2_41_15]KKS01072.1 MAG: hypothetical protein UU52_C0019G0011 [Candidatus Levybacteria bacterium GW2011_GWB1_41_21]OGH21089.1 MAG: hypothetical protein A2695_01330 [Candidatus Levybacteria bacterium 
MARRVEEGLIDVLENSEWDRAVGPFWSSSRVARLLGLSDEEVFERSQRKKLLGLVARDGQLVFPSFQFTQSEDAGDYAVLQGLEEVMTPFATVPESASLGWMIASWLKVGQFSLDGKSVIEYLRNGNPPSIAVSLSRERAMFWRT